DNLSHFIGSATESLTRTLSDFRNEKLIDVREGKIYILNKDKLKKLVN
ncbi:MAG TPA: helix-turn-helix domain-containing protein, partial [Puia sp.]